MKGKIFRNGLYLPDFESSGLPEINDSCKGHFYVPSGGGSVIKERQRITILKEMDLHAF